jgi:hypothetical protein
VREPPGTATTFIELCDFFYKSYKSTPRERLLEFLASAPDFEQLKTLSQEDLAINFVERCAANILQQKETGVRNP